MSALRRRPEDDALALFGVLVVLFTIVSLAGCLHRDPTWPGWPTPADSTRCRSEQCA